MAACLGATSLTAAMPHYPRYSEKVYDFTVTYEEYAPDGYWRNMLLVNGRSPGPVIEVEEGDTVIVNLSNDSPKNTSLHFHGGYFDSFL